MTDHEIIYKIVKEEKSRSYKIGFIMGSLAILTIGYASYLIGAI